MDYCLFHYADQNQYKHSLLDLDCDRFREFLGVLKLCPVHRFQMSADLRHTDRTRCSFQDSDRKPPRGCTVDVMGAFAFYVKAWCDPSCMGNRWHYPYTFLEELNRRDNTPPEMIFAQYFCVSIYFASYISNGRWHKNRDCIDLIPFSDVLEFLAQILDAAETLQQDVKEINALPATVNT